MDTLLQQLALLDLSQWSGPAIAAVRVVAIGVVAWIAAAVLNRAIRLFRLRIASHLHEPEQVRRAETIVGWWKM